MAKVFVVTPTYNEKQNLPVLVEKIFSLKIPDLQLIVVDDNSPDGTGALAEELAKKYPILVIHRSGKQGLGTAYVAAFKEILRSAPDDALIVQMDADLSHDPAAITEMLRMAGCRPSHSERSEESQEILRSAQDDKCDVVLGSRYIAGGRTENWDPLRKLISRFGNLYARLVLGLPYRDLTGGFKCFRREVLENIDLNSLSSLGYNFQIETTYRAHQKGYKICELPIVFTERKTGQSKFNFKIMLESFWKVIALRFKQRDHPEPRTRTSSVRDRLREGSTGDSSRSSE